MINKIRSWIRNLFGFSRSETNGTIILFVLTLTIIVLPVFLDAVIYRNEYVGDQDRIKLDSLVALMGQPKTKEPEVVPVELFRFDPNEIDKSGFMKLGFQEQVAQRIVNYRSAGGRFSTKSDLQKIYGLSDSVYHLLEPFIDLPSIAVSKTSSDSRNDTPWKISPDPVVRKKLLFDLNKADSADLVAIKGIGPVLAARIIRFRNSLGGFTTNEQLFEVYGLPEETAKLLQVSAYIEEGYLPERININFANRAELLRHPYVDQTLSRKIIEFRDKNGPFRSLEPLKAAGIMNDSVFHKMEPYLTF